jgi:hypothetical protein
VSPRPADGARRSARPPWKKALMGLTVAAGLLLALEILFRLTMGPSAPSGLLTWVTHCGLEVEGARWESYCGSGQRRSVVLTGPLDHEKPRVVFLGASSLHQPARNTIPDRVATRLPSIEVINLSSPGLPIPNLTLIARELGPLEPDLVVIYAGHNNYGQQVFDGRIEGTRLWMVPLHRALSQLRLFDLLTPDVLGLDQRPTQPLVTPDDGAIRLRQDLDDRLRYDMEQLLHAAPAPVMLSTLLRNPHHPPVGVHAPGHPDCQQHAAHLGTLRGHGREQLDEARAACGESSITAWVESQVLLAAGRGDEARAAFARSTDLDALPLRAPVAADDILRELAEEHGATLLDLHEELGWLQPEAWYTDPIHLAPEGADAVAEAMAPHIQRALAAPRGG